MEINQILFLFHGMIMPCPISRFVLIFGITFVPNSHILILKHIYLLHLMKDYIFTYKINHSDNTS